ncbi:MAG: RAMP superfamily CRISPR-associated protein [Solidesulfovibrio sp.]|uniref:RAMP superfamily CRISPR-associated protein n=1 Tax=Solidesulfovibrio sp. TaxID=2910990 RepID=UPI0031586472
METQNEQFVYMAVIEGQIVLDSVLHVGSGEALEYVGASCCFRDGAGRLVIPGSSLAGVFISRILELTQDENLLKKMTAKHKASTKEASLHSSVFRFATARLVAEESLPPSISQVRDMIRIDITTRTAKEGGKFAKEIVWPGLRFLFRLELDMSHLTGQEAEDLLALSWRVLAGEWGALGFVGGSSARGMGWFHLEGLSLRLVDSVPSLRAWIEGQPLEPVPNERLPRIDNAAMGHKVWDLRLDIRQEPGGYGIWPAIVRTPKGDPHSEADVGFTWVYRFSLDSDKKWGKRLVQVIPGSSLRGAARSLLARLARSGRVDWTTQDVADLFGNQDMASPLRFCDAYLDADDRYKMVQERVALDAFTRGVYGSAKFNLEPLFGGTFTGRIALQRGNPPNETGLKMIQALFDWGGEDFPFLLLGGGGSPLVWRDVSHGEN